MNEWKYESASDLDQSLAERLRHFPREPDMLTYGLRAVAAALLRLWLRAYHRFEVVGGENLRAASAFVMVANHASHLDALCLLSALPISKLHRAFPAAAEDYFFKSLPRIWLAAVLVNALPFARQVHIRQSLSLCSILLRNPGNVLIIFPEGTRSTSGAMQKFKPGIGTLVAGTGINVVPCYLEGTFRAWPKGRLLPRPGKLRVIVGSPRNFSGRAADKPSTCAIAAELQQALNDLKEKYATH